jgi:hypothetical protein
MMVDKVMTVTSALYFWDVSREDVETFYGVQDRLEVNQGLASLDFNETLS